MSKLLRVDLIKQYVLDHPDSPLDNIRAYAQELGATEEDVEEALLIISHTTTSQPQDPPAHAQKIPRSLPIKKQYLAIAAVLVLVSSITLYAINSLTSQNSESIPLADQIVQVASIDSPIESLAFPPVYANQAPLSADRIFSYPETDITLTYSGQPRREVVGFFPYWMLEREQDINVQGLTSINLFGIETDGQGNIIVSRGTGPDGGWEMWNDPQLNTFLDRMKKRKITVLITIKSFNNDNIERLVSSDEAQKRFIANAVQLVQSKSLDGINLDFEYIGTASEETRMGFVRLVGNLRQELKRQQPNALLTADTYVTAGARNDFFEISLLEEHLDAFIIMGYDIHTPNGSPGPVAPLEGANGLVGFLQSYLERVPAEKLILAVPYYGYSWPSNGERGETLSYAEIAALSKQFPLHWNSVTNTPTITYVKPGTNLTYTVHYDNARSLGLKYDYILNKNFQGVAIWALGYDGLNQELQQVLLEKFSY